MEYRIAESLITKSGRKLQGLLYLVAGLLLCNAILGFVLWYQAGRQAVVLLPASLDKKAILTPKHVSAAYLEAMAVMLVNDRLNVTPDTIAGNDQHLLLFVAPDYYAAFKQKLRDEESVVIEDKVASTFYIRSIHSRPADLSVTVTGRLKRWVGERLIGESEKRYRLGFSMQAYCVQLTAFNEVMSKKELFNSVE